MPPTTIALRASSPSTFYPFLRHAGAFFIAGSLALTLAMSAARKRFYEHSVSVRFTDYFNAAPPAPTVFALEDAMGPRTLLDRWNPVVRQAAEKFHVPALWLRAVMRNETGGRTVQPGDRPITSRAGALGVMQLMPETYDQMAARQGLGNDPVNPRDNIFAAAAYLASLKERYGFPGMFAAYNFGPRNWELYRDRKRALPLETRNYVKQIAAYLKSAPANIVNTVHLTRPDGAAVAIDTSAIIAIVPAPKAQYAPGSQTVIFLRGKRQAVRETVGQVAERLRFQGVTL